MSVWEALRERHPAPEWAYFEEMRNGTGWSRKVVRTADALAFSLYPSRGLELHGFEVKVSRSDWLREKKDPDKAEAIAQFCRCWFLVTTENVVKHVDEVPPAWGWLLYEEAKKKLRLVKPCQPIDAVPLDMPMIAAILRQASEGSSQKLQVRVRAGVDREIDSEREATKVDREKLLAKAAEAEIKVNQYRSILMKLEVAMGETILERDYVKGGFKEPEISEALSKKLAIFRQTDIEQAKNAMLTAADQLRSAAAIARWTLRQAGIRVAGRGWNPAVAKRTR